MAILLFLTGCSSISNSKNSLIADQNSERMGGEKMQFQTEDGFIIIGNFFKTNESAPTIILLHQYNSNKESWKPLISELQKNKFNVIAIDLRGHGESMVQDGKKKSLMMFRAEDFQNMELDVAAVKEKLNLKNFWICGSSIGANTALNVAAKDLDVKGIILLSPGLEFKGIDITESMKSFGDRPVFLIASKDDSYSASTVQKLFKDSISKSKKMEVLENAGHGTFMLTARPGIVKEIVEWMVKSK